jgi:hypothetical protein
MSLFSKKEPEYTFRACHCGNEHDVIKTALRVYSETVRISLEAEGNVCPVWQEHVASTLQILWFNHCINMAMERDEKNLGISIPDSDMDRYGAALMVFLNNDRKILSTLLGDQYNEETQLACAGKLFTGAEVTKTH